MATATTSVGPQQPPRLVYSEILSFAYETFCSNKVRFALTALGMVIGTASLILVVTIGMTGKQYVLNQIQAIGTNQIEAEYQSSSQRIANVTPDPLTIDDMRAALEEVPGIIAASPVVSLSDRVPVGGGKERDISVLGVFPDYRVVRNLVIVTGRFFDEQDEQQHNKVGVITQKMADELFGSQAGSDRQSHQAERSAVYDRRHIPRAGGHVRTDRSRRLHHADSVYRQPVLYRYAHGEADLFFGVGSGDGGAGHGSDPASDPEPSSLRVGLQRNESDTTGRPGGEDGECPDPGIAAGGRRGAAGQRHRNHEHHAGDSQLAHSRDWDSQSIGCDQP